MKSKKEITTLPLTFKPDWVSKLTDFYLSLGMGLLFLGTGYWMFSIGIFSWTDHFTSIPIFIWILYSLYVLGFVTAGSWFTRTAIKFVWSYQFKEKKIVVTKLFDSEIYPVTNLKKITLEERVNWESKDKEKIWCLCFSFFDIGEIVIKGEYDNLVFWQKKLNKAYYPSSLLTKLHPRHL